MGNIMTMRLLRTKLETHLKAMLWKVKLNYVWVFEVGVKRHVQLTSQQNAILLPPCSRGPFYTTSYTKARVVRVSRVVVSWFCVRPTSLK
jgi:hypothetical protein